MKLFKYITQDIIARDPSISRFSILKSLIFHPEQRLIVQCRLCKFLKQRKLLRWMGLYTLSKLYMIHLQNKYLMTFDDVLSFDTGLCFPHGGGIVINGGSVIGKYCTIHPCVLVGGDRGKGCPTVGDYVFIGHGAKIIGNCHIGDWVFISPGAIITKDIPSNSLVGCGFNNIINNDGKRHVVDYL